MPAHSTARVDDVVGRTVAGPMRRGEVVTDRRVVHADRMSGFPAGTVLATIRLADADALSSLGVGDRVDVVAVDPEGGTDTEVVARGVEIVTLPRADELLRRRTRRRGDHGGRRAPSGRARPRRPAQRAGVALVASRSPVG